MNPVKVVSGLLYPRDTPGLMTWAKERLSDLFGVIERVGGPFDFDFTDYYRDISPNLARYFFSFRGLEYPSGLVRWKRLAVGIEAESAQGGGRRVNIDPGYLDGARLVLASTKDNAHRIYLSDGIYAELTLRRVKSGWERFSYTFPDFRSGTYDGFLDLVRLDWRRDIRGIREIQGGRRS
ncbi:MAG: DUF4416 family protein [Synergistaceae bacterium]|jgi:hypothetical protein|nr:DUF4416 family protein [Synergistaceae bacterium]